MRIRIGETNQITKLSQLEREIQKLISLSDDQLSEDNIQY